MNDYCQNLDAYLADDLSVEDASLFAAHLEHCDACRDAVNEQRWIDGLLRSGSAIATKTPPPRLQESLRSAIAKRGVKQRRIAWATAAAAALVVALGWVRLQQQWNKHRASVGAASNIADQRRVIPAQQPSATFVAGADLIAVPVASDYPDVTVVRVYSTYQPRIDDAPGVIEPETNPNSWERMSNGG